MAASVMGQDGIALNGLGPERDSVLGLYPVPTVPHSSSESPATCGLRRRSSRILIPPADGGGGGGGGAGAKINPTSRLPAPLRVAALALSASSG